MRNRVTDFTTKEKSSCRQPRTEDREAEAFANKLSRRFSRVSSGANRYDQRFLRACSARETRVVPALLQFPRIKRRKWKWRGDSHPASVRKPATKRASISVTLFTASLRLRLLFHFRVPFACFPLLFLSSSTLARGDDLSDKLAFRQTTEHGPHIHDLLLECSPKTGKRTFANKLRGRTY
jgi:hypothetical protein